MSYFGQPKIRQPALSLAVRCGTAAGAEGCKMGGNEAAGLLKQGMLDAVEGFGSNK